MKAVYKVSGPINDLEGASVYPKGIFQIPSFDCPYCRAVSAGTDVWYASLKSATPQAVEFNSAGVPESVSSYKDYALIRNRVRRLFETKARLLPGSLVGIIPIEVGASNYVGNLTSRQLYRGIDFIAAGTGWIVSERVARRMREASVRVGFGSIVFRTGRKEITGYQVLELEPQAVWAREERIKYGVTICNRCGDSKKASLRGTFDEKRFQLSVFDAGYVIVRASENREFYVNEALCQILIEMRPSGVLFEKAGEVTSS